MNQNTDAISAMRDRLRVLEAKIAELQAERDRLLRFLEKSAPPPVPLPREWALEGNRTDPALREP